MAQENSPERLNEAHDEYYEQAYLDRVVLYLGTLLTDCEEILGIRPDIDTAESIVRSELNNLEDKNLISQEDKREAYKHFIKRFGDVQ